MYHLRGIAEIVTVKLTAEGQIENRLHRSMKKLSLSLSRLLSRSKFQHPTHKHTNTTPLPSH